MKCGTLLRIEVQAQGSKLFGRGRDHLLEILGCVGHQHDVVSECQYRPVFAVILDGMENTVDGKVEEDSAPRGILACHRSATVLEGVGPYSVRTLVVEPSINFQIRAIKSWSTPQATSESMI
ncbi:hypothetical protein TNCT_724511 [Trichonephila clavata]|uniref:Uncharacterized protein n=1 Tax=Trichonephila clavata TaxID=2740835 RepID=A0A8X6G8Z6_TRICU|nr:hypothetical protein TNCT_724511 [Trichonephila clavata]